MNASITYRFVLPKITEKDAKNISLCFWFSDNITVECLSEEYESPVLTFDGVAICGHQKIKRFLVDTKKLWQDQGVI